jgi:hypothetical protein
MCCRRWIAAWLVHFLDSRYRTLPWASYLTPTVGTSLGSGRAGCVITWWQVQARAALCPGHQNPPNKSGAGNPGSLLSNVTSTGRPAQDSQRSSLSSLFTLQPVRARLEIDHALWWLSGLIVVVCNHVSTQWRFVLRTYS